MKHIFLNLKRFDVPGGAGRGQPPGPVAEWGRALWPGTQQGLTGYDPAEAEFVDFFPEAHLIPAAAARTADSRVELGCQGVFRADTAVGGNFGAFTTNRPAHAAAALAAAGSSSATARSATTRRASWRRPASPTPPPSTACSTRR